MCALGMSHPGVAENIAPVGGPGSDVIAEGIPPWDNSWVQDGSFYTLTKAECYWGVAKAWPIGSGQMCVWSMTSWTPNGCNILCYPRVVISWQILREGMTDILLVLLWVLRYVTHMMTWINSIKAEWNLITLDSQPVWKVAVSALTPISDWQSPTFTQPWQLPFYIIIWKLGLEAGTCLPWKSINILFRI